jgi:serine/threonine protein kinase
MVFARKSIRVLAYQAASVAEAVKKEVEIVRRLRHAHVISIHSLYKEPKSVAIIMSPVADGDLNWFFEKCVEEEFPASLLSLLRNWFACLSNGLAYIHSQNVRHKDIKPANILVRDELVYYTDFGLAKDFDSEMTSSTEGYVLKTPMYSPTEVISEERRSRSADVFSLGCVFAEMATLLGKRSVAAFFEYRVNDGGHAYHSTLDKVAKWLTTSTPFNNFIGRMLSIQPEKRPSAAKIRHIIDRGGGRRSCRAQLPAQARWEYFRATRLS